LIGESEEHHVGRQASSATASFDFLPLRAVSDDEESGARNFTCDARKGVHEFQDSLVVRELAHEEVDDIITREAQRRP